MPPILFASESYVSRSLPLSSQRCCNAFAEMEHNDAKSQMPLMGAPGLTEFATVGTGPHRGSWYAAGVTYFVSGNSLYSVDTDGTPYLLGSGIAGFGQVSMSDNGEQVCIVNGSEGYIYTIGTDAAGSGGTLVQITDPDFHPANTVTYYDTYFVFDWVGTNMYFLSNPNDGLTYNGLLFASAEAVADFVIGCEQNLELLYIFGQKHIEMWYNAGTADFPFQLYAGGVITRGLASPYAKCKQDDAIFFLGTDGVFYRLQGITPIRISTHPIENAIADFTDVGQAFCFTYTLQGHKMVHLTFPVSNVSFVWDVSTQRWHERESWGPNDVSYGRWRGNTALQNPGNPNQILIGDAFTGKIGLLDWNTQTEYGNTIRMLLQSVPLHKDRKRIFISRLEFNFESGVGTTTGQGQNPVCMLSISRDSRTFIPLNPQRNLGAQGRYFTRQRYLRLGQSRQFVFQLSITDPVKRVMISTHADISVGM